MGKRFVWLNGRPAHRAHRFRDRLLFEAIQRSHLLGNAEEVETFVASPAIAIAEDAFGRELEEQVAVLNATQTEAEPETKIETGSQQETPAAEEGKSKEIETAPATA